MEPTAKLTRSAKLGIAVVSSLLWSGALAKVTITFEGISEELQGALRAHLELAQYADREISPRQANALFADAEQQIQQALQPYGYYHAKVEKDLQRGEQPGDYLAHFRITPGEPVIVDAVHLDVGDQAFAVPTVRDAVQAFHPIEGEILHHGLYEGGKSAITTALQTSGFFDAKLTEHRVAVVQADNRADIDLRWDSGERYRSGPVRFTDAQFSDDFLQRYVPWKDGELYSTEQLLLLQQRLVDADYFATVAVQPDVEHAADGVVPIEALLIPAKRTIYSAGVYVSTDAGPGVRFGADRRWINDRGHKLGGKVEYSQRLQETSLNYRIPKPGLRSRDYTFAAGYRDEQTDTSTSRTSRLAVSEVMDRWHGFTRTLGLQYLNGDFIIAEEQRASSLLFAEAMITRKRVDNVMFPERGVSVTYGLRFAPEGLLSDTSFAQLRAEARWIRPAWTNSRLILRAAAGGMVVQDFDALPPELRFFAGGDRSIRGFDYQQIGEENETGGVIGGKFLAVASSEFEYYFKPKWGAAVFVDAGDAYSSSFSPNVGAGVGVRWRSPVGIVRVDVAVPVATELEERGVRLHINIGPDL
jgi:translocation and assembly module TamA